MIGRLWRKRLYRPEALGCILRDALGGTRQVRETRQHLEAAAQWILRAQAATPDDGVSGGYCFEDGWIASYPETTGYTIPTLLAYSAYAGVPLYCERAIAMARWELRVQLASGAFPGHFVDRANPPVVFNTGQVIFGLLAAFEATGDPVFLAAARRAGEWVVSVQDPDGAWRKFEHQGHLHSYNTRTAWALVELAVAAQDDGLLAAARRNLDWALRQQLADGWCQHAGFTPDVPPFLHTIAYTTQGLLEAGLRLKEPRYLEGAERACRAVLRHVGEDGWSPGAFDAGWRPAASYSCLTGNAQMAVQWFRLASFTGEAAFREGALRTTAFLKATQDCENPNPNIRGGIKGSHPIYGRYLFGTYPNWATKFFMDALLLEESARHGTELETRCW